MSKTEYDEIKANLIKKSLEKNKTDVYVPIERRKKDDARLNFINLEKMVSILMIMENINIILVKVLEDFLRWE